MFLLRLLKKYPRVIISHRNSGFGDNLMAAANAWRYAKDTNRALVIFWQYSRYLTDKRENAFSYFFNVHKTIEGVPVIAESHIDTLSALLILHPYFLHPFPDPLSIIYKVLNKSGISAGNLFNRRFHMRQAATDRIINDSEDVKEKIIITQGCYVPNDNLRPFFDSLELKPEFQRKVDQFADKFFKNKKVIGVHIRYYNKTMPISEHTKYWQNQAGALTVCLNKIKESLKKIQGSEYVVFLSTDSRLVQDFITGAVDNVVVFEKDFGSDGSKELHQEVPAITAAATVIEMFLLAKSDILVRFPPGSWFSHYASLYAKEIIV